MTDSMDIKANGGVHMGTPGKTTVDGNTTATDQSAVAGQPGAPVSTSGSEADVEHKTVFSLRDLDVYYGSFRAVRNVELDVYQHQI
ncbi:MAG: hypothetical protein ACR2N9_06615, partial [Acidimicrobiia bacterium]